MKKTKVNYFDLFKAQSECFCKAARLLEEIVNSFDTLDILKYVSQMHEIENAADLIKRGITQALLKEFLPPIEREDIMLLSNELDNVTDSVEDILLHLYMYNITKMTPEGKEFIAIIRSGCESLNSAVGEFGNFKKSTTLKDLLIEVNSNEDRGDTLFAKSMRRLYTEVADTREIMSWTKIYGIMEDCCDTCEHAADAIEAAVLKNT